MNLVPETVEEFDVLVAKLRKLGLLKYRIGEFELVLGEAPFEEEPVAPAGDGIQKDPPRGKDGLTAQEQIDRYGEVIDAR